VPSITVSIDVARSAEDVFAYATDSSRFREWQKGVVSELKSNGTPQVGDSCLTTRRIGLSDRPSTAELVRFDPPHHWGVRGVDGPIRAMVDVKVEPRSDTSAHLTIALDFEGHGIGRFPRSPPRARRGPTGDAGQGGDAEAAPRGPQLAIRRSPQQA
jgi:hypothetical protein